jgi:hypothetical protein
MNLINLRKFIKFISGNSANSANCPQNTFMIDKIVAGVSHRK